MIFILDKPKLPCNQTKVDTDIEIQNFSITNEEDRKLLKQ